MVGVNKVILVGNLGADPDIRTMQSGKDIVNLRVATSDSWKDRSTGERRVRTEWHRVVIFNEGLARVAKQYLKKGSKVYLEGALQTREWEGEDGIKRYSTEVILQNFTGQLVMLDGRNEAESSGFGAGSSSAGFAQYDNNSPSGSGGFGQVSNTHNNIGDDLDDEIPF